MAAHYGAAAIGLVSSMPSGPGVIAEDLIEQIASAMPAGISSFLLTCKQEAREIIAQQRRARTNTLQLCDRVAENEIRAIRSELPGVGLVQVIHVQGDESFAEAAKVAPLVNSILLDSGNQNLAVKELGGTGRTHNWEISRRIRDEVGIPVFLAGGLNSSNVAAAIERVRPFGVDVCSGVRTNGKLDEEKLAQFFDAVRR